MKGGLLDLTFVPGKNSAPQTLLSLLSGQQVDTRFFQHSTYKFLCSHRRVIVREFDLDEVPKEQEEASAWLHKLWLEKDLMKEKALEEDWEGLEKVGMKPFEGEGVGRVMALQRFVHSPHLTQLIAPGQAFSCAFLESLLWSIHKCARNLSPFLPHKPGGYIYLLLRQ